MNTDMSKEQTSTQSNQETLVPLEIDAEERKKVVFYYILFFGSAAIVCIPFVYTSIVGLIVCGLTLVGLYSAKSGAEEDSYLESHMIYLIHTFWYAGLFMFYAIIAACLYLLGFANYIDFYECSKSLPSVAFSSIKYGNIYSFIEANGLCLRLLFENNYFHIMIAKIISSAPIFCYLLYRYIKGWLLAVKHCRIEI